MSEFPFKSLAHAAAWLAGLLTPLARPAFGSPAPLTLIDANAPAAGMGKLANLIHVVLTGRPFAATPYPGDGDELRKCVTGYALAGTRLVLFDNLTGRVGGPVLDAALTATAWAGRPLYGNEPRECPLATTLYGTGNNVRLHGDLARRTLRVRLETPLERPDGRAFLTPDIEGHAAANRAALLSDALTILAVHFAAGRPTHGLLGWGSSEAWSAVVREAVVFAGLPAPAERRDELRANSDRDAEVMAAVIAGLREFDPRGEGVTAAEVARRVEADQARWCEFRAALEEACEPKPVSPSRIGYALRGFAGRTFGGYAVTNVGTSGGSARRAARRVATPTEGGWWDGGMPPAPVEFTPAVGAGVVTLESDDRPGECR